MSSIREIVGVIPAGGQATRLAHLPCSKELFPIGWHVDNNDNVKPKVVSQYLLEKYKAAGIKKCYLILRKGKWDIPQYYGDGEVVDMDIAYLMMNLPHGHPFTLDQAFPFTQNNLVAFGYPDILFSPDDGFTQLVRKQTETNADVVLGIFPIRKDQRWTDILAFDNAGKIKTVSLGDPSKATQRIGWSIALWTPKFSAFMHDFLGSAINSNRLTAPNGKEYTMNHVFQAALDNGMAVDYVTFQSGYVHDVGTPDDLFSALLDESDAAKAMMMARKKM
jgi:glucose-1-phosphate thymidylyltransferase